MSENSKPAGTMVVILASNPNVSVLFTTAYEMAIEEAGIPIRVVGACLHKEDVWKELDPATVHELRQVGNHDVGLRVHCFDDLDLSIMNHIVCMDTKTADEILPRTRRWSNLKVSVANAPDGIIDPRVDNVTGKVFSTGNASRTRACVLQIRDYVWEIVNSSPASQPA